MANKINSRTKGNRFERDVAKYMQEWTGYEFGRVPSSGGLRWKKTDNITGDITCTDTKHARRFPFSIECKFYNELKFEHLLLGNKSGKIVSFWEQCKADGVRANKVPMLVMRYNQMAKGEYFIMFSDEFMKPLLSKYQGNYMTIGLKEMGEIVHVVMASSLLEVEYQIFYKHARKLIKRI